MISLAYEILLSMQAFPCESRIAVSKEFCRTAIKLNKGQEMDIDETLVSTNWPQVEKCYALKTGSLYATALKGAAILAEAGKEQVEALGRCGYDLGLSVQCFDDVADVVMSAEEIGKPTGQDNGKATAVTALGINGAKEQAEKYIQSALSQLDIFDSNADCLRSLICHVARGLFKSRTLLEEESKS
jgi:geranylgeranyl pyrophosphate synthase